MTVELLALILSLRPIEASTIPHHLGRAVHAQFLRWVDHSDPTLANQLHEGNHAKPFTCSTLIGATRNEDQTRQVDPSQIYRIRLTGLNEIISHVMLSWLSKPPKTLDLDGVHFKVEGLTANPEDDPWAGQSNYHELAAPYLMGRLEGPRRLTLQFVSPTTFRSNEMNMPIPLPNLVFGSLVDRWNAYSTLGLSPDMRAFCESQVSLGQFNLRSQAVPHRGMGYHQGCVGRATYIALNSDRYWRGLLHILGQFAFYSGVGRQTAIGLGQTRLI